MQEKEMKRQVLLDRDLKPLLALQSTYNIPQCDNYLSQLLNIQLDKYRCLPSTISQKGTKIGFNFTYVYVAFKEYVLFLFHSVFFSFGFFSFLFVFYVYKCFLVSRLPSEMVSEKFNGENGNKSFWLFSPSVQAQLLLTGKIASCL